MYHPAIIAVFVLLVVTSYLLKTRTHHYFTAHYVVGIMAISLFAIAVPIALYEVSISGGSSAFPPVIYFHFANFFVAGSLIIVQTALGLGMLVFGRRKELYSIHKRLSKYVLTVILLQAALGLLVYLFTFILT